MATYQLRDVPTETWDAFTRRAKLENWPIRPLLLQLMQDFGAGRISPSEGAPPEKMVEYAWLRPMFRDIMLTPDYLNDESMGGRWRLLLAMVRHRKPGAEAALEHLPAEQVHQLIGWLTATTPAMSAGPNRLSLRAAGSIWVGPDMTKNRRVYQYEVVGLPPGQHALIVDLYGAWRLQRIGLEGQEPVSETGYPDARAALEALEGMVSQDG